MVTIDVRKRFQSVSGIVRVPHERGQIFGVTHERRGRGADVQHSGGPGFWRLSRHKVGKTAAIFLKACDDFALSAFNATLNFRAKAEQPTGGDFTPGPK